MKRRPSIWLFISAFFGALVGTEYESLWLVYVAIIILFLPLIRSNILSIFSILLFTFLISAISASYQVQNFLSKTKNLPKNPTIFYGQILDISQNQDGSMVALARLGSKKIANFSARIYF